jgi:hypothetical protein
MAGLDPRLRIAVDANVAWCDEIVALHGGGSIVEGGLWSTLGPPPPLHPDAMTVEPAVPADAVLRRLDGREHSGVKDSFALLDLGDSMEVLFEATWIHRRPAAESRRRAPAWSVVTRADGLAELTSRHDTSAVLLPALLERGHFRFLARYDAGEIVAGAVARLGGAVVDVSNVFAVPGNEVDWRELVEAIEGVFPGRPMVGYEAGAGLGAALDAGFAPVGDLRVWVR